MSELAFDKEGEPIEQHEECELWRVRRFRNPGMRGTCETVREDDGAPLYVEAECSFLEFKRLVGAEAGFYRLDQCDVRRQPITDAAPAYVSITEGQRNNSAANGEDSRDSVIKELARANADMCRTIAGQASDMMRAAAELMRAADGAGIPRRAPLPPVEPKDESSDDDDDDDEDDEDDDGDEQHQANVWSLIEQMLPSIQVWLASTMAKRSAATPPAAAPAPASAPAPAPAPAAAPSAAPVPGGAAAGPTAPPSSSTSASASPGTTAPAGESPVAADATAAPSATAPADAVRNSATPTADQVAHLFAIRARLTPREAAIADAVVTRMTPVIQAQWLAELSALTVEQAVEVVRSMIPKAPPPPLVRKDGT